ncbi:hypothetical protein [Photobacterium sanguinicancri]|uniref:Uncharacterized protein n=1 Tax=Photobacterium sanguinicancri TaxID=875932 RepID=A0AAW7Y9D0_9GAMM|nr:hypothetical protein [Photobacterium sanguinicancri]MDO6543483.1 hypothetical protein [Photobacterium sanguinicancri]
MSIKSNVMQFQLALFFTEEQLRPDRDFYRLDEKIDVFDLMPTIQPLPEGITVDNYPLMKFSSTNQLFTCDISQTRLDLYLNNHTNPELFKYSNLHAEFRKHSLAIIDYVYNMTNVKIMRAGVVADYASFCSNPAEKIGSTLLKRYKPGSVEISVRQNIPITLDGIDCNNLYDIRCGGLIFNKTQHPAVMIQRDINHRVFDKSCPISEDNLKRMVSTSINELTEDTFTEAL